MNIFTLLSKHPKQFAFSLSHSFLSGYGQSFFLGLFTPYFITSFSLSNTEMTFYYFLATMSSALIMLQVGTYIDRVNLKLYSTICLLGLASMCIILSFSFHVSFLFIGLLGLRLFGQSLMTHISATSISRYFTSHTGKALSIATLGHPLGELALSALGVYFLFTFGWRDSFLYLGMAVIIVVIPALLSLFKTNDSFLMPLSNNGLLTSKGSNKGWTRKDVLKNGFFYVAVPVSLVAPFVLTGFFIHQNSLMESKGWSEEWRLFAFAFFPIIRIVSGFWVGFLIDKYSVQKVFTLQLLPTFIGLLSIIFIDHKVSAILYYGMAGMALGLGSNLKSALWVQRYGRENIGSIRSVVAMLTAFSTAISPLIFGILLDNGITASTISILNICILMVVFVSYTMKVFFEKPTRKN